MYRRNSSRTFSKVEFIEIVDATLYLPNLDHTETAFVITFAIDSPNSIASVTEKVGTYLTNSTSCHIQAMTNKVVVGPLDS